MLDQLVIRDVTQMNRIEIEEECRELEDAYAEALMDNAGFDALTQIWRRIQDLKRGLENNRSTGRDVLRSGFPRH